MPITPLKNDAGACLPLSNIIFFCTIPQKGGWNGNLYYPCLKMIKLFKSCFFFYFETSPSSPQVCFHIHHTIFLTLFGLTCASYRLSVSSLVFPVQSLWKFCCVFLRVPGFLRCVRLFEKLKPLHFYICEPRLSHLGINPCWRLLCQLCQPK